MRSTCGNLRYHSYALLWSLRPLCTSVGFTFSGLAYCEYRRIFGNCRNLLLSQFSAPPRAWTVDRQMQNMFGQGWLIEKVAPVYLLLRVVALEATLRSHHGPTYCLRILSSNHNALGVVVPRELSAFLLDVSLDRPSLAELASVVSSRLRPFGQLVPTIDFPQLAAKRRVTSRHGRNLQIERCCCFSPGVCLWLLSLHAHGTICGFCGEAQSQKRVLYLVSRPFFDGQANSFDLLIFFLAIEPRHVHTASLPPIALS